MNTICCWGAFKAVWWKQSTHANHANPLICSVCLVLSPMISARCQRCARRGWQTSRGRCLDYLASQTWQVAVSVSVHVILRLRDSGFVVSHLALPEKQPPAPFVAQAWLSPNGPRWVSGGFSHTLLRAAESARECTLVYMNAHFMTASCRVPSQSS